MKFSQTIHDVRKHQQSLVELWLFYDDWRQHRSVPTYLRRFAFALFCVVIISGIHSLVGPELGDRSPFLFYIIAVTVSAWYGSTSAGIFAILLSILAAIGPFRTGNMLILQTTIFVSECLIITLLIASLRYTISLSQERLCKLQENADQLSALVNGITDYAIYLTDPKGFILSWSDAASAIQGFRSDEVIGRKFSNFYLPEELAANKPERDLQIAIEQGRHEEEGWVIRKDGTTFWANKIITVLHTPSGEIRGFANVTRDMTERKEAENLIRHQAYHDAVTELPNRVYLQENLSSLLKWAKRREEKIGILFLDIDRFKAVNDSLGHHIGDLLLKEVAKRLASVTRSQDMVARLGGDEFVVILNVVHSATEVLQVAAELSLAIKEPIEIEGRLLHMQVSIGAALYPEDGLTSTSLLQNADVALYQSKRTGITTLYHKEMNANASERLRLENELRTAVKNNELQMYYQPIFSINKGQPVAAEALIRWQHPRLGMVSPAEFIPLAEETGMIIQLGEWVLEEVCRQQAAWIRQGLTVVPIAINLSARQFAQKNIHLKIQQQLDHYRIDPKLLTVEVTESVAMHDIESTVTKLNLIRSRGILTAIDDFGTGFSSLNYLKQLPISKVKIDKSFVEHCVSDTKDGAIIRAIISMAHTLELKVVAEGIEDAEQLQLLKTAHCDLGQGYLVSRPETAIDFSECLGVVVAKARYVTN